MFTDSDSSGAIIITIITSVLSSYNYTQLHSLSTMIMISSLVILIEPTDTWQMYRPTSTSRRGEKEILDEFWLLKITPFFFHWYVYIVSTPGLTEQVSVWCSPAERLPSPPVIMTINGRTAEFLIINTQLLFNIYHLVLYWQCG